MEALYGLLDYACSCGGILAGGAMYLLSDKIGGAVNFVCDYGADCIRSKVEFDPKRAFHCLQAIKSEIMKQRENYKKKMKDENYDGECQWNDCNSIGDGPNGPTIQIGNGCYKLRYKGITFRITIENDKVTIRHYLNRWYNWSEPDKDIHDFLANIYKQHNTAEKAITFYGTIDNKWNFPYNRRPRNINRSRLPILVKTIQDDITEFVGSEAQFKEDGLPYRMGYLLIGGTGTGKTLSIELAAIAHNRSVYLVNLNSEGMTDAVLNNLVSSVPAYSIIAFDEFEKQIDTMRQNKNCKVSYGGILSALDGPQRLSHGTIVILTANSIEKLPKDFINKLMRLGRIDKYCEFTQTVGKRDNKAKKLGVSKKGIQKRTNRRTRSIYCYSK